MSSTLYLECVYIASSLLFVLSLKGLQSPSTSKTGNLYGILGMLAAIVSTYFSPYIYGRTSDIFLPTLLLPAVIICIVSLSIKMTSMPEMVALLNSFGGLAAALESFALYFNEYESFIESSRHPLAPQIYTFNFCVFRTIFYLIGAIVGLITFTGSIVACLKLRGYINTIIPPQRILINSIIILLIITAAVLTGVYGLNDKSIGMISFLVMSVLCCIFGILCVLAIGGADMPVVISVLNTGSGWAGVFTGLMLNNSFVIISGAFVGASGIILSYVMCKAMNRSLVSVLMGGFGDVGGKAPKLEKFDGEVTVLDMDRVVELLKTSRSVAIIPGYGMAVSHAQFAVYELCTLLRERGVRVLFGVHPVAGRMPGHMNVLLAEASVPYDLVLTMEEVNPLLPEVDVAVVIGANDTVNPAAEMGIEGFALEGMPVIQVWKARQSVVLKRSLNVGYAGVDNLLFVKPNNGMLLGDAKTSVMGMVERLRGLGPKEGVVVEVGEEGGGGVPPEVGGSREKERKPALMRVGVLKEEGRYEKRCGMCPSVVELFLDAQIDVFVEESAGVEAGYCDGEFVDAGATVVKRDVLFKECSVIIKINAFTVEEVEMAGVCTDGGLNEKKILLCGFLSPASPSTSEVLNKSLELKVTLLSLDVLPRTSVAQKMDVLSSMALLGGNRSVIEAFYHYGRSVGQQMTAAGKYPQAKVFVIGAGVAGLAAVGEAHRAGAEVRGFDVRLECKEQVESMGGKYLVLNFEEDGSGEGGYAKPMGEEFIKKEMELFEVQAKECDIIITTAAIPGREAPKLLMKEHVELMKKGSVIVDLAAATGGNCELTKAGEVYVYNNKVTIIGLTDLASRMARQASEMFARNVYNFISHVGGGEKFNLDISDPIVRNITITKGGEKLYPAPRPPPPPSPPPTALKQIEAPPKPTESKLKGILTHRYMGVLSISDALLLALIAATTGILSTYSPPTFPPLLFVFMLGCWVGYMLIWNVAPALHTPLMSVSNAISGAVIIGAMLGISEYPTQETEALCVIIRCPPSGVPSRVLNFVAIGLASMNVFGGFTVSQRMLGMFKKSN